LRPCPGHEYFDEKCVPLAKLAALVDSVVNPRDDNVAPPERKDRAEPQA
jgi:hypothetical protein